MAPPPRIRILVSETFNPWFNLATEDWIFREMDSSTQTLFLWRNAETVVIGRNQNPWSECNLKRMEEDNIFLARRTSGGGAVFHDLGNTNFTFLSPKQGYDKSANVTILLDALRRLGVSAEASGRNDLVIPTADGPRKISGSAYRESRDRAFHHGTFLISTDLTRLSNYLTPHPKKLESKGQASVRARVMNINQHQVDVTHERLCDAVMGAFCDAHGATAKPEVLNHDFLQQQPSLQGTFDQFSSWDWRFGNAPRFNHQMIEYLSWGFFEVHVDSEQGHITRAQVFSDALFPDLVQDLQATLVGKPYRRSGVKAAVDEVRERHPGQARELEELAVWMMDQVEV
ncbi:lipoate--protein ligase [Corallococcus sp. H22C18031201]|uniref:lipoate--protein ligase n=1 Tax=Citreicoccus inhibens TaxID=2849499 RepID=UPI000E722596|nr:lipoate--protein ligase [Citreicoccus inhibens]MBU8895210.1 lipoate--protein ligase [Citreicoccus inhibens]RJS27344.1 lipoate--protein ligase [Corallococcus sp. H22C18031201]